MYIVIHSCIFMDISGHTSGPWQDVLSELPHRMISLTLCRFCRMLWAFSKNFTRIYLHVISIYLHKLLYTCIYLVYQIISLVYIYSALYLVYWAMYLIYSTYTEYMTGLFPCPVIWRGFFPCPVIWHMSIDISPSHTSTVAIHFLSILSTSWD